MLSNKRTRKRKRAARRRSSNREAMDMLLPCRYQTTEGGAVRVHISKTRWTHLPSPVVRCCYLLGTVSSTGSVFRRRAIRQHCRLYFFLFLVSFTPLHPHLHNFWLSLSIFGSSKLVFTLLHLSLPPFWLTAMKALAASFFIPFCLGVDAVAGQATYDAATGRFNCSSSSGNFCAGDSLQTNCVFRCGSGYGTLGNCNDTLAGRPPIRVKSFASCKGYQTSPTAGDAVCKYDCVISDNNGTQILVSDCTGTPIASARSGLPSYLARQATDYLTEAEIPPYPIRDNATHRNATGTAALRATPSNYTNNAASGFLRGYAVLTAALASVSSL